MQYGTDSSYACFVCCSALVVVVALFYVVAQYLVAGNVAFVYNELAILLLVVYAVVVEQVLGCYLVLLVKRFVSVDIVFVCRYCR